MVAKMINSTGKQSEMLNNLKTALGDQLKNPNSGAALRIAKLKQLGTMQQLLLSSLAKQQQTEKPKEPETETPSSELTDMKQLLELQNLQQMGASFNPGSLLNTLRQNALLHSLKAADSMMKAGKMHSPLKESPSKESKQRDIAAAAEVQSFFGKLPQKSFSSDLGDVSSEKATSKLRLAEQASLNNLNEMNMNDLLKSLEARHTRKLVPALAEASVKPVLSNLLSESFLSNLKTRQARGSRIHQGNKNNAASDKVYSTIGNESRSAADSDTEENGHTRTTRTRDRKKTKTQTQHNKLNFEEEKTETGATKAAISRNRDYDIDEENLSKKAEVRKVGN